MLDWTAYPHFSELEFVCPCGCGKADMQPEFMDFLQSVRTAYGQPIGIVSGGGFRCLEHEPKGGAHTMGLAADLNIPREDMHEVQRAAYFHGVQGVGAKQKDGRWQLHLDMAPDRPEAPRPWFWTY